VAALAAWGCVKKDPSPADAERDRVADLEGDSSKAAELAAILRDPKQDDLVRAQAAASLGRMPSGAGYADVLIAALEDPSPVVRRDAAEAAGNHAFPAAADPLINRLRLDPAVDVRRAAAVALGKIRSQGAVPGLIAALEDPDPGVQVLVSESLEAVTGQKFGRDKEAWDKWAAGQPK